MEALVEQLWKFVGAYGLEIVLLAFVTIFLVGVVKVIFKKGFAKMNVNARKAIYETLSLVFAFALTTLWMYAKVAWFGLSSQSFDWMIALKSASVTAIAVKAMYPIYEGYGLRALVRLLGNFIVSWFKKGKKEEDKSSEDAESGPVNL